MGCASDSVKRQTKDIHPPTQANQKRGIVSVNATQTTIKSLPSQKQAIGQQTNLRNYSSQIAQNAAAKGRNNDKSVEQIIKKYKIPVKQSMYKTNSIHAFKYQSQITYNPPAEPPFAAKKEFFLDTSYNLPFSQEITKLTKLRLSKQ